MQKTFPSLVFYNLVQGLLAHASSARLGELTSQIFFFRGNITMAPYRLAFAYSNPLKLDQTSIIYFKQMIVIIIVNLKNTGLPCSDVFRLSSARKGRRSVGRDPQILYTELIRTAAKGYIQFNTDLLAVVNIKITGNWKNMFPASNTDSCQFILINF